jgi:sterol desaturase/sphingolipid hydroxylase (fatty acid hydroxylase superfamily)
VTPGLHRLHHSIDPRDHDRNFGQLFSWWDRVFGTYTQPAIGGLRFGLAGFEEARWQTVRGMLLTPLRGGPDRPLPGNGTGSNASH